MAGTGRTLGTVALGLAVIAGLIVANHLAFRAAGAGDYLA